MTAATASASTESTKTANDGKTQSTEKVKRTWTRGADSKFATSPVNEVKAPLAFAGVGLVAAGVAGTLAVQRWVLPRLAGGAGEGV